MRIREFDEDGKPLPRRGMTSIEAAEFLKQEFPDVPQDFLAGIWFRER